MWKKLLVIVVMFALLVPGCRRRRPPGPPAGAPDDQPKVLTVWHIMNYAGPREALQDAVDRFKKNNPNFTVDVQPFDNDAFKQKLSIETAGGRLPDVFHTWGGGGLATMAKAGKVLDLTDELAIDGWGERFLPAPLGSCTVEERVYAVPVDVACVPLWYNADLFARHKLTPPKTFVQMLDVSAKLRAKGVTPVALGNMKQWPGAFHFVYLATRIGGTPLFLDAADRKPGKAFNDPAFVQAGERLQQLVKAKVFTTGFNGVDVGHARTQFLNDQAAMYLMGTWLVARAKKENAAFLPRLKCAAFPTVKGGKGDATTVVGGTNCAFAVSRTCAHPAKAVELLRYLTDAKVAAAWAEAGRIPALKVTDETLARLPAPTRSALELLNSARAIQPYYDQYLPPRLAEEHKSTTQGLFAGTLTPKQAADRMENRAKEKPPEDITR